MDSTSSSRKPHRKTRTGCKTCKSRKIKCDETRPSCNNCRRHLVQCEFPAIESNDVPKTFSQSSTPSSGPLQWNANVSSPSNGLGSLNMQDLELLHHFSVHTAPTLHADPAMKTLFRVNVPQLGFSYEFVMRGILSISALHLARFKQQKSDYYMAQADYHQQAGLRMATSIVQNLTEDNCSAVYIFSVLALFYASASPRKPGDFLVVSKNGVADWLFLLKGTSFIISASHEALMAGPLGPLFEAGGRRWHRMKAFVVDGSIKHGELLAELQELINKNVSDTHELAAYRTAVEELRKTFILVYQQDVLFETGDILVWLMLASEEFLQLLRRHTPEALSILAYFCVLLKRLDQYWWMDGWGTYLISKIYYMLDQEHRLWIQWPIEEIGWVPS